MRNFGFLPDEIKFAVFTSRHWLRHSKSGINDFFGRFQFVSTCHWLMNLFEVMRGAPAVSCPTSKGFLVTSDQLYKYKSPVERNDGILYKSPLFSFRLIANKNHKRHAGTDLSVVLLI